MSRYGRAAATAVLKHLEHVPEGFRHQSLFAAACRLGELAAGNELDASQAHAALVEMGRVVGLSTSDVLRQVGRGLERGARQPRSAPTDGRRISVSSEAVAEVVVWWAQVQAEEWRGARAATDLRLLGAFALLAVGAGKLRIEESLRELSEATGVSLSTVHNHIGAITPWVRLVRRGSRFTGSRSVWQLVPRRSAPTNTPVGPLTPASVPTACALSDPGHGLWHRWSTGWRLWCLLENADGPVTVAELARVTGLCRASVRRGLARFAARDLAERLDDMTWIVLDGANSDANDSVVDHQAVRRIRHASQRACWRRWREGVLAQREQALAERRLTSPAEASRGTDKLGRSRKAAADGDWRMAPSMVDARTDGVGWYWEP